MRNLVLGFSCLVALGSTVIAQPPAPVAARLRHVVLHVGHGVELDVDDLRGALLSRTSEPPMFDDINSYVMNIEFARVAMTPNSLSNLLNNYVFAAADAPIRKISTTIEGNQLVQKGELKKGVAVPFSMRANLAAMPDGRLRVHPTSLKAAGFVSKRVLDFFGLELEKLVTVKESTGVTVDGDDLILDPQRMLPPPRIRGRVTKASIENGAIVLQFGDPSKTGLTPPTPKAVNYMYYRGGTLRFGKLTMSDADLLLVDSDPKDPFDFNPEQYNRQLVAGYSKNTPTKGLIVYMPDANDLAAKSRPRSSS